MEPEAMRILHVWDGDTAEEQETNVCTSLNSQQAKDPDLNTDGWASDRRAAAPRDDVEDVHVCAVSVIHIFEFTNKAANTFINTDVPVYEFTFELSSVEHKQMFSRLLQWPLLIELQ